MIWFELRKFIILYMRNDNNSSVEWKGDAWLLIALEEKLSSISIQLFRTVCFDCGTHYQRNENRRQKKSINLLPLKKSTKIRNRTKVCSHREFMINCAFNEQEANTFLCSMIWLHKQNLSAQRTKNLATIWLAQQKHVCLVSSYSLTNSSKFVFT